MANILITTTPLLSNIEIKRYICPLTANVVLGVNFYSDLAAAFTDTYGGNSKTYQRKLDLLTNQVGTLIREKAMRLGANAVIDYRLSLNEISGKGKQMFMVTGTGTACVIVVPKEEPVEKIGQITYAQVRRQYLISLYSKKIQSQEKLVDKDWENIFSLNLTEIAAALTKEYLRLKHLTPTDQSFVQYLESYEAGYLEYLSRLNKDLATKVLYSSLNEYPDITVALAVKYNLFNPKAAIELIHKGRIDTAIYLISAHKETYTSEDLKLMKEIVARLDLLPDKGHYQTMKIGLFSKKEEEIYICPNGHKNCKEAVFCEDINCGLNIKGLNSDQQHIVQEFKGVVEALGTVLNRSAHES